MKTILVVEDEPQIRHNNCEMLNARGYKTLQAADLEQARRQFAAKPDAILLDIMLPDGLGLDLLRELRERGDDTPVCLLTAWGKNSDIVRGLELGADEYISKPFDYDVLCARIHKMLQKHHTIKETLTFGKLTLNIVAAQAKFDGVDLLLTQKEFALLLLLIKNKERSLSPEYLYEQVWDAEMPGDSKPIRTTISKLRKKLESVTDTIIIENAYNEGYSIVIITE